MTSPSGGYWFDARRHIPPTFDEDDLRDAGTLQRAVDRERRRMVENWPLDAQPPDEDDHLDILLAGVQQPHVDGNEFYVRTYYHIGDRRCHMDLLFALPEPETKPIDPRTTFGAYKRALLLDIDDDAFVVDHSTMHVGARQMDDAATLADGLNGSTVGELRVDFFLRTGPPSLRH